MKVPLRAGTARQGFEKKRLLEEGLQKFGLVKRCDGAGEGIFYYGINTSRRSEPLDQLDVPLLISRLRKSGLEVSLIFFVAGRYGQLNGRQKEELVASEKGKVAMLDKARRVFDGAIDKILCTDDLWYAPAYWEEVGRLGALEGIVDCKRTGRPFREVFAGFEPQLQKAIPEELATSLGNFPAPSLYRLLEVAEASYLVKSFGARTKIGPLLEEEYDVFIRDFMGVVQLEQPVDFNSVAGRMKPITPYIGKENEQRIFLSDSKEEIVIKVMKLAQRASGQPMISQSGYMNPFVRLAALAVEAAANFDSLPVPLGSLRACDGASAVTMFEKAGTERLTKYAPAVAECIWAYLICPIQKNGGGKR